MWQSHAKQRPALPAAPSPRAFAAASADQTPDLNFPLEAPEASPKSREEKRFARYDKDKDGKVEAAEYLQARRKNFEKLDIDHDGALSFNEYAAKGIEKFVTAGGRKGWLSPAEFVKTAPPPAKHKSCSCSPTFASRGAVDEKSDD